MSATTKATDFLRYTITAYRGKGESRFYVIRNYPADKNARDIVASFVSREAAERHIKRLETNHAHFEARL